MQFSPLTRYPSSIIILLQPTDQVVYLLTICHPNNQLILKHVLVLIFERKNDNENPNNGVFVLLLFFEYFCRYLSKNTFCCFKMKFFNHVRSKINNYPFKNVYCIFFRSIE